MSDTRLIEVLERVTDRLEKHAELLQKLERSMVELQTKNVMTADHEMRIRTLESDSVRIKFAWSLVAFLISAIVSIIVKKV